MATVTGNTVVAGGVEHGNTHQAELHVLIALALLVEGCQVGLVVAVGRGDDLSSSELAAVLGTLVAAVWVRVDGVLGWVIAAFVGAVAAVNGVKEIVEGSALDQVTDLVESNLLWVHQGHGVLQIQVRFAVEVEGTVSRLHDTAVDQVSDWALANLLTGEVPKEHVQVGRNVGLGSVLDDTVRVLWVGRFAWWKRVEGTQAVRHNLRIAVFQLRDNGFPFCQVSVSQKAQQ